MRNQISPEIALRRSQPSALAVVLTLLLIAVSGLLLATHVAPRLIGGSPLTISTSVMAPTLRPGDLAVVRPVNPEALALGDVVAFYSYYQDLVAQRVVELVSDYDGAILSLVTRVDAAYAEYSRVAASAIMGRIAFSLPVLGYVATAPIGLWISVLVGALLPVAIWHQLSFVKR